MKAVRIASLTYFISFISFISFTSAMVVLSFLTLSSLSSICFSEETAETDKVEKVEKVDKLKVAKISSVEYELQGKQLTVKVQADQSLEHKNLRFETTPNGERIFFLDIPNTYFLIDGKPHYNVRLEPPSPVFRIKISQYRLKPAITRAVFFLREPSLPTIKSEDNTLIFEISPAEDNKLPTLPTEKKMPTLPTMEKNDLGEQSDKSADKPVAPAPVKDDRVSITQIRGFYEAEFTKLFIYSQGQIRLKQANLKPGSVLRVEFANDTIVAPDPEAITLPVRGLIKQVVADGAALMIYLDEKANYEIIPSEGQLLISFQNPILYRPVSLNLYDEELGKVILMLFKQTSANILIDKGVEVSEKVTTQLEKIPLKHALDQLLESHGYGYKQVEGGIIRVLPLNKLRLESDTQPKEEPIETKIFWIKYVDPAAISTIIQQLTTDGGKVVSESQTKTIVVKDTASSLEKIEKMISQLDRKMESEANEQNGQQNGQKKGTPSEASQSKEIKEISVRTEKRLVKINYADPDRVRALLTPLLSEHGKIYMIQPSLGPEATPKGVNASSPLAQAPSAPSGTEAKKRGGHIIIEDVPEALPGLEEAVKELDKPTPQVDIEVYIVSGNVSTQSQAGINWSTKIKSGSLEGTASSNSTAVDPGALGGTLQLGTIPAKDFSLLLNTLSTKADVQVLSNPRITVLENQGAHFVTGKKVPFTTSETQAAGVVTTSTQFEEVGIVLDVTPRVMSDEMVSLEVEAEISELESIDPRGRPIINSSNARTELFVKNGHTAVIGGFSKDEQIKRRSQIPVLGELPILGKLFGSSKREKSRSEVTIFITLKIVSNQQK